MKAIKAVPNYNKRTFTLNVEHYYEDYPFNRCLKVRYRTLPFDKDEFNELTYNTYKDWINFLSCPWYSQSYYLIKQYQ
jgi:hypothetical protein